MAKAAASYEEMAGPFAERYGLDVDRLAGACRAIWNEETGVEPNFGWVALEVAFELLAPEAALQAFEADAGRRWCAGLNRVWDRWNGAHMEWTNPNELSEAQARVYKALLNQSPRFLPEQEVQDAYAGPGKEGTTSATSIISRLRQKDVPVETARDARRVGKQMLPAAKGYRLSENPAPPR